MEDIASMAAELARLDQEIASLRGQINEMKARRDGLVARLRGLMGPFRTRHVGTPLGQVSMQLRGAVVFPTGSADPEGHRRLVDTIRGLRLWMEYSAVNYPRLKSDWLNRRVPGPLRSALGPMARESEELVVTSPRVRHGAAPERSPAPVPGLAGGRAR